MFFPRCPDRRPVSLLPPEVAGLRASLTFRAIGTFVTPVGSMDADREGVSKSEDMDKIDSEEPTEGLGGGAQRWVIWGQGAVGKTRSSARPTTQGGVEADRLLTAFGEENRNPEFEWEGAYGDGFDVVKF